MGKIASGRFALMVAALFVLGLVLATPTSAQRSKTKKAGAKRSITIQSTKRLQVRRAPPRARGRTFKLNRRGFSTPRREFTGANRWIPRGYLKNVRGRDASHGIRRPRSGLKFRIGDRDRDRVVETFRTPRELPDVRGRVIDRGGGHGRGLHHRRAHHRRHGHRGFGHHRHRRHVHGFGHHGHHLGFGGFGIHAGHWHFVIVLISPVVHHGHHGHHHAHHGWWDGRRASLRTWDRARGARPVVYGADFSEAECVLLNLRTREGREYELYIDPHRYDAEDPGDLYAALWAELEREGDLHIVDLDGALHVFPQGLLQEIEAEPCR